MKGQDHEGVCVFEVYTRLQSENVIGQASRGRNIKRTILDVIARGAMAQTPRLDREQRIAQTVRRAANRLLSVNPQSRRSQSAGVVSNVQSIGNQIIFYSVEGVKILVLITGASTIAQYVYNKFFGPNQPGGRKIKKNITRKMKSKKIKQKRLNLKNKTKRIKFKTRKYKR
jgi:hypothetical protein